MTALRRAVPCARPVRLRQLSRATLLALDLRTLALTTVIVSGLIGLSVGPREMKIFAESKNDVAGADVKRLAYEAYPSWLALGHAADCPTIDELLEYTNLNEPIDPWGGRYEVFCHTRHAPSGLVAHSPGEDGRAGTDDDLWSR